MGFEHDEALSLGRVVAGLNAYLRGVSLGLFQPTPQEVKEQRRKRRKEETVTIDLLHRAVPADILSKGSEHSAETAPSVLSAFRNTWRASFGEALEEVSRVMTELAQSLLSSQLAEKAYGLYKKFRPGILPGKKGWGASVKLDLDPIRKIGSA